MPPPFSYSQQFIDRIKAAARDPQSTYTSIARQFHIHRRSVASILGRGKPGPHSLEGLKGVESKARELSSQRVRSVTGQFVALLLLLLLVANHASAYSFWSRLVAFAAGASNLSITTSILPIGQTEMPYGATLSAAGGKPPYRWSPYGLPVGFTMSSATISGGSASVINSQVQITVTDSRNKSASKMFALAICAPLTIPPQSIPNPVVGQPFSYQLISSGGVASANPPLCIVP